MTITQIETNISKLIKSFSKEGFVFDFMFELEEDEYENLKSKIATSS